ncbi:Ganglioside induced differentiation associated protein [Nowakowskiella sp. JEL0407]|nr:Ganglioside induced differentiation associated protein [Nowakowskiella sp. JEL0407]
MVLQFYDNLLAYNPARARIVLLEKKIPYKTHHLNLFRGDQFAPAYVRINPNAWAPTMIDPEHDKILYDSKQVAVYVDNVDGKPLGGDKVDRKLVDEWVELTSEWDGNVFYRSTMPENMVTLFEDLKAYNIQTVENYKSSNPDLKDLYDTKIEALKKSATPEEIETSHNQVKAMIEKAHKTLSAENSKFLAGSEYSLADALFTVVLVRVVQSKGSQKYMDPYPSIKKYYGEMRKRPTFEPAFGSIFSSSAGVLAILPTLFWIQTSKLFKKKL